MVAGVASPWPEAGETAREVRDAVAVGTETISTSASRTDHSGSRISAAISFGSILKMRGPGKSWRVAAGTV